MGFMSSYVEQRFGSGESSPLAEPSRSLLEALGIAPSIAGVNVTETKAEGIAAVYGCVGVIADIVSWLPLKHVEDVDAGGTKDAKDHPNYYLFHDAPNHLMTAIDFKNTMERWKNLYGTAYAEIQRNERGEVVALWPLRTDRMEKPKTDSFNRLTWTYRLADGSPKVYTWDPIRPPLFRLMINSLDGITGRSPIRVLMDSMGAAIASRDFGGYLFANKANPGGILKFKTPAKDAGQRERNKENWNKAQSGIQNAGRTAVLEGDVDYTPIGIPPQEAQFIELMAAQRLDIRGYVYRVPGFLVGDTEKSTSWGTGIEQQMRGFLNVTMMPHLTSWTQAIKRDCLSAKSAARIKAIFVTNALVQADLVQRVTATKMQIEGGLLTPNEGRALDDLGPRMLPDGKAVDPEGNAYWRPLNMSSTATPAVDPNAKPDPEPDPKPDPKDEEQNARITALEQRVVQPITVNAPITVQPADVRVEPVTINMPAASAAGKTVTFKRDKSGAVTGADVKSE